MEICTGNRINEYSSSKKLLKSISNSTRVLAAALLLSGDFSSRLNISRD